MENQQPLWSRFKGEGSQAFEAFAIYRDMGPHRSYKKVLKELGAKESYLRQIQRWAQKYKWGFRAMMYDDHLEGVMLSFKEKELEELHAEALSHARDVLQNLIDITSGILPPTSMSVNGIEVYFKIIGLIQTGRNR
jgi:hypothetical protein